MYTFVLPVNESRFIFLLLAMASPTSAPPHTVVQMAEGRLLATRTLVTIFEMAIEVSGVVGAPFLGKTIARVSALVSAGCPPS